MDLNGKVALFWETKNTADIIDVASGEMVQEHEVEGSLTGYVRLCAKKHCSHGCV